MFEKWKTSIKDIKKCYKNVFKIYRKLWSLDKLYLFLSGLIIIVDFLAVVSRLYLLKLLIGELVDEKRTTVALIYVAVLCGSSLIFKICTKLYEAYNDKTLERFKTELLYEIENMTMNLEYSKIENSSIIDQRQKAMEIFYPQQAGFMNINNTINGFRAVLSCIFQIVGIIIILMELSPLVFVSLIGICVICSILNAIAKKREFDIWDNSMVKIGRRLGYFQEISCNFSYAKEIRINRLGNWVKERMFNTAVDIIGGIAKAVFIFTAMGIISGTLILLQNGALFYYLSKITLNQTIQIEDLVTYINAILSFVGIATQISEFIIVIQNSGFYIEKYLEYMELGTQEEVEKSKDKKNKKQITNSSKVNIEFKNVWFRYPNTEEYILKNLNLKIHDGTKTVIVGENGAGKTTLIKLLLRMYKPTKGEILINGVNINQFGFKDYMKHISAVFQDFQIFNYSLLENIAFTNECDKERVNQIIDELSYREVVDNLPKAEETVMGKMFDEDGVELSGGQQQKLAIARALYKDTNLVILDEPTAMLSPKAEYDIYTNFNYLVTNKTAVYISHRMSCCRFCDQIIVLQNGEVIEHGNHKELIAKNGVYKEMFDLQADFYKDLMVGYEN